MTSRSNRRPLVLLVSALAVIPTSSLRAFAQSQSPAKAQPFPHVEWEKVAVVKRFNGALRTTHHLAPSTLVRTPTSAKAWVRRDDFDVSDGRSDGSIYALVEGDCKKSTFTALWFFHVFESPTGRGSEGLVIDQEIIPQLEPAVARVKKLGCGGRGRL